MTDIAPLTPADCDLRDFPHTPLFRARLFGSSFHARATDSEWRAGVTLWLKSWDQVPAGSLPNDDVELCRLAELARDLKTWKKLKDGALRGWIVCSDGRLYHPVVAEGINNAIEKKAAQRSKTAKARIAALEKRLKEANTADDKDRITEELRKLRLTLSQTEKSSVTDHVTGSKRREGEGEGNSYSVPIGTDAAGVAALTKAELWTAGKSLLESQGMPKAQCGSFVGKLVKDYTDAIVIDAVRASVVARPADAAEYLKAACQHAAGQRQHPNKQEALEQRNRAVAAEWVAEMQAKGSANATV